MSNMSNPNLQTSRMSRSEIVLRPRNQAKLGAGLPLFSSLIGDAVHQKQNNAIARRIYIYNIIYICICICRYTDIYIRYI